VERPEETVQGAQMRQNLEELRAMGVEPYPRRFERTHIAEEIHEIFDELENTEVIIAGRLTAIRGHGKAGFADLRDGSGGIQLYVRKDEIGEQAFAAWKLMDVGDIVGVKGEVFRTRAGEVSVKAIEITLLAKALLPLPEKFHGLKDKEQRYRQRYLDLIANEEVREVFAGRSVILSTAREFLEERGYMEVETPVLQPLYGGAFAQPFETHHHALDMTLYLRIADELYLKRLIVGGFERVFEIGKDFRNEGMDRTHSPEFTQLELYEAYADYNDMMDLTEALFEAIAIRLHGETTFEYGELTIDLKRPWRRLRVMDAVADVVGADALVDRDALFTAAREKGVDVEDGATFGACVERILDQLVEPNLMDPTFLIDYPREISPLAKQTPDDPEIVERFEVFVAGFELGNSFSELNDPDEQLRRFEAQVEKRAEGDAEAHGMDEDFVTALMHGMPPTGGLGLGIDRIVMLFTGAQGIRDVILFPPMRPDRKE